MSLLAVITFILALSGYIRCEAEPKPVVENGVLVLTQANFQTTLKEHEFILVEFCKYSIIFLILYDNLASFIVLSPYFICTQCIMMSIHSGLFATYTLQSKVYQIHIEIFYYERNL